jgi:hypothetical protein
MEGKCLNRTALILDGLTVRYELKKPFAVLMKMNEKEEWCARQELNLRPQASEACTLSN